MEQRERLASVDPAVLHERGQREGRAREGILRLLGGCSRLRAQLERNQTGNDRCGGRGAAEVPVAAAENGRDVAARSRETYPRTEVRPGEALIGDSGRGDADRVRVSGREE